jgi:hypothetical protein
MVFSTASRSQSLHSSIYLIAHVPSLSDEIVRNPENGFVA